MAVSEIKLLGAGAAGSAEATEDGQYRISYTSTYQVKCDDQLDDASVVLQYFRTHPPYPWIGRSYRFGNGFDVSSICKAVRPTYIEGSGGSFLVVCEFADPEVQPGQGQNQSQDPLTWTPEIEVSYGSYSKPVEYAIFMRATGASSLSEFLKPGIFLPVTNSAQQAVVPTFEEEYAFKVIRFTTNVAEYDDEFWETYNNAINDSNITINIPKLKFRTRIKKHWAKLLVSASLNFANNRPYYRRTLELQIKDWNRGLIDKGTVELYKAEEFLPDQTQVQQQDIPDGRKTIERPAKDIEDLGLHDEFPLDGKGKRLKEGSTPVTLYWRTFNEENFSKIMWV